MPPLGGSSLIMKAGMLLKSNYKNIKIFFLFLLLELILFICGIPATLNILKFEFKDLSYFTFWIATIIGFLLYEFCVVKLCFKGSINNLLKMLLYILPIKIITEIAGLIVFKNINSWNYLYPLFSRIFHVIVFVCSIFIYNFFILKIKKIKINNIAVVLFVVSLILLFAFCFYNITVINNVAEKYNVKNISNDIDFGNTIYYLMLSLVTKIQFVGLICGSIISFMLFIAIQSCFISESNSETAKKKEINWIIKLAIIILGCGAYYFICLLLTPESVITKISYKKDSLAEYPKNDFSYTYSRFYIVRGIGDDAECFYVQNFTTLFFDNDEICSFETNPMPTGNWNMEYIDDNMDSIVCQTEVIAYKYEDTYKYFKLSELDKIKEDKKLTRLLEELVERESFDAIEVASPYLLKYDKEFIVPYLERIKNGTYTENERSMNYYINDSYMKEYADKLLNR